MARLQLRVSCSNTSWGESVAVVGSWVSWDKGSFTLLSTDKESYPVWRGDIALDQDGVNEVEYKYVLVKDGSIVTWESDGRGGNRTAVPGKGVVDDGAFGGASSGMTDKEYSEEGGGAGGDTSMGNGVDTGQVDVVLSNQNGELDEFEQNLIRANSERTSWRQRLSFVRGLFTSEELAKNAGFDKTSVAHLVTLCIYLTYLSSGQIRCEDADGHHRPNHHALEARKLNESLGALARNNENDFISYLIRRIYPTLPSYAPQYTASTPLTRIRDIAHRSDIPSDLKGEIKHDLQNKLHRCAGPEDIKTCERILAKVTAPGASYSQDFVHELKVFHKELLDFFNAVGLEDRLRHTLNDEIVGLPGNVKDLSSELLSMKERNQPAVAQLLSLTKLRKALVPWMGYADKPDIADADLQRLTLLDIGLETYAFTLLAAAAASAENERLNSQSLSDTVEGLALAMENLKLSSLVADQASAAASELRASYDSLKSGVRILYLRFYAAVERSLRLCEDLSERTVELFGSRVGALSGALKVAPHAAKVFAEAQIRAHCFFQASRISSALLSYLRAELDLPPWEALKPGTTSGSVKILKSIADIEDSDESVVAIVEKASGDEDIPKCVKGVVLGHDLPSLSHLGVRARQAGVVFACALDASEFSRVTNRAQKLSGVQLVVSDKGEVTLAEPSGKIALQKEETIKPGFKVNLTDVDLDTGVVAELVDAKPETCGSKCAFSGLLSRLSKDSKDSCAFEVPSGLAVPFKAFAVARDALSREYQYAVGKYDKCKIGSAKDDQADSLRRLVETEFKLPKKLASSVQSSFSDSDKIMVRSSANCEDLEEMSGAGLYDSIANVNASSAIEIESAILEVWGSLWSRRAARSRATYGYAHSKAFMGVLVQKMVRSKLSFVAFSQNPISGNPGEVYVELAVGMGETLASAGIRGNPLRATFDKKTASVEVNGFPSFGMGLFPSAKEGLDKRSIDYSKERVTTDEEFRTSLLTRIGKVAAFLEQKLDGPQDIEGAIIDDTIHVVQTRPMVA